MAKRTTPNSEMPPLPAVDPKAIGMSSQVLSPSDNVQATNYNSWGQIPVMTSGMTFREVGSSGLRQFSGWIREEWLASLVGRQGTQKYREMLDNSPIVGALMFAITSTMRKVEWRILPANDSPAAQEVADFIDSCRNDMSHTFEDFVAESLSMLGYGYAPFELVYKQRNGRDPGPDPRNPSESLPSSNYDDGKIGWRRTPLRGQDTVLKWFFDVNGTVKGMTQQPWVGPIIDLPIEKMLLFRPSQNKGNPEGRSILRTAYTSYYYVKRLQEQEAILFERLGGVPLIKIPAQILQAASAGDAAATQAVNAYKSIVVNLRNDEQMGLLLPSDMWPAATGGASTSPMYSFELVTPQIRASGIDFDKTITRYNVNITTSVLADFLSLGHETRGTQSLAVSKVDMFFQAIEGFLNSNAAVYNRYAIPRLMALNGMNHDLAPTIEPDLAQRVDLDVLSNFILRLSQAGMPLFPNEELQSYILDAGGLPDVEDEGALQAAGLEQDQLDTQDAKDQAALDRMQQPPQPPEKGKPAVPGNTPLEKMLLAALAKRQNRMAGPRFGIITGRRKRHVHKTNGRANGHA